MECGLAIAVWVIESILPSLTSLASISSDGWGTVYERLIFGNLIIRYGNLVNLEGNIYLCF